MGPLFTQGLELGAESADISLRDPMSHDGVGGDCASPQVMGQHFTNDFSRNAGCLGGLWAASPEPDPEMGF